MGFTNPPPLGALTFLGDVILVEGQTNLLMFYTAPFASLFIAPPSDSIGQRITIDWYADATFTTPLATETHFVGSTRRPVICTQCKGAYAQVGGISRPEPGYVIPVYGSSARISGSVRFDADTGTTGAYLGFQETLIPPSQLTTGDVLTGFAASGGARSVICAIVPQSGTTTTTTLTPKFTLSMPGFAETLVLPAVTGAAITTPTEAQGTLCTAPVQLPALPDGGMPFQLALSFTLSASSASRSYVVDTHVY